MGFCTQHFFPSLSNLIISFAKYYFYMNVMMTTKENSKFLQQNEYLYLFDYLMSPHKGQCDLVLSVLIPINMQSLACCLCSANRRFLCTPRFISMVKFNISKFDALLTAIILQSKEKKGKRKC